MGRGGTASCPNPTGRGAARHWRRWRRQQRVGWQRARVEGRHPHRLVDVHRMPRFRMREDGGVTGRGGSILVRVADQHRNQGCGTQDTLAPTARTNFGGGGDGCRGGESVPPWRNLLHTEFFMASCPTADVHACRQRHVARAARCLACRGVNGVAGGRGAGGGAPPTVTPRPHHERYAHGRGGGAADVEMETVPPRRGGRHPAAALPRCGTDSLCQAAAAGQAPPSPPLARLCSLLWPRPPPRPPPWCTRTGAPCPATGSVAGASARATSRRSKRGRR